MSDKRPDEPFYIGYLPRAPARLARFVRKAVIATALAVVAIAAGLAVALPYFGNGHFEFGRTRDFAGVMRCGPAPRLEAGDADYLLVGAGKLGLAPELCALAGNEIALRGTLIERDGIRLIEVADTPPRASGGASPEAPAISLGRFTLQGEIVDAKCYFGVMNPGEGQLHRACAVQCLRGGLPAAFVIRDRTGAAARLLIADPAGRAMNARLLPWAGEAVEAEGEILRQGRWLVFRVEPESLRLLAN